MAKVFDKHTVRGLVIMALFAIGAGWLSSRLDRVVDEAVDASCAVADDMSIVMETLEPPIVR